MGTLRLITTAAATMGTVASIVAASPTPASAALVCSKWAATTGSDANDGTQAAPYRSLGKLVASLQPGQSGCLPAGQTYFAVAGNGVIGASSATPVAPITVTSAPGGPATVKGQLWRRPESHDVVLSGINFRGGYTQSGAALYTKGSHIIVHGDRIALTNNDIADPRGICIGAGKAHATDTNVNDVAEDLQVSGNRIHGCGMDAAIAWQPDDSGSHGIYLENTLRAHIFDNLLYDNRWRGLQLWPRNDGAVIEHNLFDGNATHVNIGSSLGAYGGTFKAQNTTVRDNIMTSRVTSFMPSKNPSQLYGFFPAGSPSYGNNVGGNCFAPGDPAATGNGFTLGVNTIAQPLFADSSAHDYRLLKSSPCIGKGPKFIQPPPDSTDDWAVSVTAPTTAATGDETVVSMRVQNRSASSASFTLNAATTGGKLLDLSTSAGTCTATTCTGTVPASGTVTASATVGATVPGSATTTARLSEDQTPADNTASATTAVNGPACTIVGSDAVDTAQGTAANEVFCLFGGDDTVMPGAGNDVIAGGSGTDRLSYWNSTSPVVINLGQSAAWDARTGTAVGYDTFRNVEWATGSAFADTLVGGVGADILDGLEGTDELWGYAGNDTLKGWSGNDRLYGGDGRDALDGGSGTDACNQGLGSGSKTSCEL